MFLKCFGIARKIFEIKKKIKNPQKNLRTIFADFACPQKIFCGFFSYKIKNHTSLSETESFFIVKYSAQLLINSETIIADCQTVVKKVISSSSSFCWLFVRLLF